MTICGFYTTSSSRLYGNNRVFSSELKRAAPESWKEIRKRYGLPDKPAGATDPPVSSKILQALKDEEAKFEKDLRASEMEYRKAEPIKDSFFRKLSSASTVIPLLMVIKDIGGDAIPPDIRQALDTAMDRLISDQEDIFDTSRKQFALATTRRIEVCKKLEIAVKDVTEAYLIKRAMLQSMGAFIEDEGWERLLLDFQEMCRTTTQKLEEVEARLKKPRKRRDLKPGHLDKSASDNDEFDVTALEEAVEAVQQLEFAGRYIFEHIPKAI